MGTEEADNHSLEECIRETLTRLQGLEVSNVRCIVGVVLTKEPLTQGSENGVLAHVFTSGNGHDIVGATGLLNSTIMEKVTGEPIPGVAEGLIKPINKKSTH